MEELRKLLQELLGMVMGGLNQATQVRVEDNKHCIVTHDFLSEYESTISFLEELGLAEPLPKCEWRLRFDKIDEVVEQKLSKQAVDWDKLRARFFLECVDSIEPPPSGCLIGKLNMAPHDMFEWFRKNILIPKE